MRLRGKLAVVMHSSIRQCLLQRLRERDPGDYMAFLLSSKPTTTIRVGVRGIISAALQSHGPMDES